MRRLIFIVTIFTILFSNISWGSDLFKEEKEKIIERVKSTKDAYNEVDKTVSILQDSFKLIDKIVPEDRKQGVIILGKTGAGKSTLMNYLTGVPLKTIEDKHSPDSNTLCIRQQNSQVGSPINGGSNSETRFPFYSDGDGYNYIDCPGLLDSQGEVQDIINAYSIYKVLKNTPEVKVMTVASIGDIYTSNSSGRAQKFKEMLKTMIEYFSSDMEKLMPGLSLVVTKNGTRPLKDICEILKELKDEDNALTEEQKQILELLSDPQEKQIAIFNRPKEEGVISQDDKPLIEKVIENTDFIKDIKLSFSLPAASENLIRNLVGKIKERMDSCVESLNDDICKNCKPLIKEHKGKAWELRDIFREIANILQEVTSSKGQDFVKNGEQILQVFNKLHLKELSDKFSQNLQKLEFLRLIAPEDLKNNNKENIFDLSQVWNSYLNKAIKYMEPLYKFDVEIKGTTLTLKGYILGTSDLQRVIGKEKDEGRLIPENLAIVSINSLFIDEDIAYPGANLILKAPFWKIVGRKCISLKGREGNYHELAKASNGTKESTNGQDGAPGNPGQNGGHFYGHGEEFENLHLLKINTSGGKGSKGQDGGDGHKGKDGEEGNIEDVENKDEKCRQSATDQSISTLRRIIASLSPFITMGNIQEIALYRSGKPAENGGDGGKGGAGGKGGNPGLIEIIGVDFPEENKIQNPGNEGKLGSGGEGGKGGGHKNVYEGVYINVKLGGLYKNKYNEIIGDNNQKNQGFFKKIKNVMKKGCVNAIIEEISIYSKKAAFIISCTALEGIKNWGTYGIPFVLTIANSSYWHKKPHLKKYTAIDGKKPECFNKEKIKYPKDNPVPNYKDIKGTVNLIGLISE